MHYPKVLERVGSPEQIFHRSFSLGAPDMKTVSYVVLRRDAANHRSCRRLRAVPFRSVESMLGRTKSGHPEGLLAV